MTPVDPILDDDDGDDPPADRRLTTSEQKLQRWVDLLAALLIRHRHATFEELAKDVPGYDLAHANRDSVLRTFERDKDELRRFGVPIETIKDGDETLGYRIDRKSFYLPYLQVAGHERDASAPTRVRHDGYRSLGTLAFEPDELDAIVLAAARVRALGDPVLAREAEAAIRKLALDLPLGAVLEEGVAEAAVPVAFERPAADVRGSREESPAYSPYMSTRFVSPRRQPDASVFDRLSDALARRKVVTFDYFAMERGEHSRRTVEPYGLFFVSAHWYLAGHDTGRDGLRNFRLSRISKLEVNSKRSQSPDYEIPAGFSLRDHAQAREPWEIGDGEAMVAVVEFTAITGATHAALALGRPVEGSATRRAFEVRRVDAFARWLLSFGGDARPVAPASLCAEYERVASATMRRYASAGARGGDAS